MYKFVSKPVLVDAIRVSELLDAPPGKWKSFPKWVTDAYARGDLFLSSLGIEIKVLGKGRIPAALKQWVIRNPVGDISAMTNEEFKLIYDPVEKKGEKPDAPDGKRE